MGRKQIGTQPTEIVDQYDVEAEQLGLSRNQYLLQCIEAGRAIFQSSGQADIERLRELTEDTKITPINSDLTTANSDLAEPILLNLPTEEQNALTKQEIRETIFGTEDEQIEQITEALKQLRQQEKITVLVDNGYIKTND